jgi:hypothetical protein
MEVIMSQLKRIFLAAIALCATNALAATGPAAMSPDCVERFITNDRFVEMKTRKFHARYEFDEAGRVVSGTLNGAKVKVDYVGRDSLPQIRDATNGEILDLNRLQQLAQSEGYLADPSKKHLQRHLHRCGTKKADRQMLETNDYNGVYADEWGDFDYLLQRELDYWESEINLQYNADYEAYLVAQEFDRRKCVAQIESCNSVCDNRSRTLQGICLVVGGTMALSVKFAPLGLVFTIGCFGHDWLGHTMCKNKCGSLERCFG